MSKNKVKLHVKCGSRTY